MKYPTRILAVLVAALVLHFTPARAAGLYWTNTLGGNWSDAVNWSPNQVPAAGDDAFITQNGTYTVNAADGVMNNLTVGAATGTQTFVINGGGYRYFSGTSVFASNTVLNWVSGDLIPVGPGTITVHGQMNWQFGHLAAPFSLNIAPTGVLNISGAMHLNAILTNAGTVVWSGADDIILSFFPGGNIYNLPGGIFDVQNDQTLQFQRFPAAFVNAGTFRKSAGSGATTFGGIGFVNTGTVEVQTGLIQFPFGGFEQMAGALLLNGGNVSSAVTLPFIGGLLEGSGQILADVEMAGQLSPGLSAGLIEIQGNYIQTASGNYHVEIGGLIAGTNYDQVIVTGSANLAGTIDICSINGFTPAPGDRFEIMTFASMSGSVVFTGLNIANGVRLEPVISSTNIVLVATNASFNAAGIYWTNTLGGSWTDAANWSPNQVPGPADQAFIIQDGTYTVSVYGVVVSNLIVGAACGTQTVVIPQTGFFDSYSVRFIGDSLFASNTILNVAGGVFPANVIGDGRITIHGQMNLTESTHFLENVAVTIATNAVLNFSGSCVVQGVITNEGRINWVGTGNIRLDGLARIYNLAGGVFDVQNDQVMAWNIRGGVAFYNAGLFRKSAGVGTTLFSTVPLFNTGTVEMQSGTLRIDGYGLFQTAGATLLNGGNLSFGVPFPAVLQIDGGLLAGSGIVEANGSSVTVSDQFSPGQSAGRVEILGNYIQTASGSYKVEIGGPIAGTNYDQVVITSNATLAGTIDICSINGFTPAPGDRFEIMTFASMSGSVTFTGLNVTNGVRLEPVISGTNIVLVAFRDPDLDPDFGCQISRWRFDEASGNTALDSAGGNPGTLVNGPLRVPGRIGSGALQFDGINDHVNVPHSASLNVPQRFSISLWFRPGTTLNAASGRKDLFKKFLSYWVIMNYPANDGKLSFVLNSGGSVVRSTTTSWTAGQWYHVAATHDGATMRLYVNGVLENSLAVGVSASPSTYPVQIGGNTEQGYWFPGVIDDARLFCTNLAASTVLTLFNGTPPPPPPVNTRPVISDLADRIIAANSDTGDIPFIIGDAETAAGSLVISATSSNTVLVPNANFFFNGSGSNRTVRIFPAPTQNGVTLVTLTVSDGFLSTNDTFLLTVTNVPPPPPPLTGTNLLISRWQFDEASGNTALDLNNLNPGTLVNGPLRVGPKVGAGALQFDGLNDHVNVPDRTSLDLSNRFSIAFWFKPSQLLNAGSGRRDLLQKFLSYWVILNYPANDGKIAFVLNSGHPIAKSATTVWNASQWYHVAATYDGVTMRLYINGVLEGSAPSVFLPANTTYPLQIGGNTTQGYWFPGAMDDVRLYGNPLSAPAITDVMNGLSPLLPSGGLATISPALAISVESENDLVVLKWSAQAGRTYRVEFTDDLATGDWTPLPGDVTVSGTSARTEDTLGISTQRFYRVVIEP